MDAHPAFYSKPVEVTGIENSSHVILTFRNSSLEEVFQKPVLQVADVNNSSESQEESPLPPVRRKRAVRRYAECSSDDEDLLPKSVRRRSQVSYRESDSSSEGESGFGRLSQALRSSKQEGSQKLKLVLDLLSQSTAIETVLHFDCRITSLKAAPSKPVLPVGVIRGCSSCRSCQKVVATWHPDAGRRPCLEEAPVFFPDEEEFKDPLEYIATIRERAEPYGICRVVPPRSWRPPCPLREESPKVQSMLFPTRVQQVHKLQVREPIVKDCSPDKQASKRRRGRPSLGRMGTSSTCTTSQASDDHQECFGFEPGDAFPLGAFEKYADDFKDQYFRSSDQQGVDLEQKRAPTVEMIEGEYWRIVEQATDQIEVLYGADVETGKYGSGFPKAKPGAEVVDANSYEKSGWNLNNIARFPGSMLSFEEGDISGVLVPWLYIGMCFSSFCWHVEDHHFYSLNYMHWGAPKVWYGVPGSAADKLEAAMKKHLPDLFDEQPDLLHKLVTQLSPSFLKQEGVPVYRLVQRAGDFVITFPHAYHSGFNSGFNVAEAVNVAPVDWLPHGQAAVELYREQHRKTSVSHDKLLLRAARVAVKMSWHSQQNQSHPQEMETEKQWKQDSFKETVNGKVAGLEPGVVGAWQAYCGEGGVLAKALKMRVGLERARQDAIRNIAGEGPHLTLKQMDSSFDVTDERECEVCKYDLHLSAIGCGCLPNNFVCLLHGHLLCSCPWSMKTLLYRYDLDQLGLLLAAVEGRPGAVCGWINQEIQIEKTQGDQKPEGALPRDSSDITEVKTPDSIGSQNVTVEKEVVATKLDTPVPEWGGNFQKLESETSVWPVSGSLLATKSLVTPISSTEELLQRPGRASLKPQDIKEVANQLQNAGYLKLYDPKGVAEESTTKQAKSAEPTQGLRQNQNLVNHLPAAAVEPSTVMAQTVQANQNVEEEYLRSWQFQQRGPDNSGHIVESKQGGETGGGRSSSQTSRPSPGMQLPQSSLLEVILLSDDDEDEHIPEGVYDTTQLTETGAAEQVACVTAWAVDRATEEATVRTQLLESSYIEFSSYPEPEVLQNHPIADFHSKSTLSSTSGGSLRLAARERSFPEQAVLASQASASESTKQVVSTRHVESLLFRARPRSAIPVPTLNHRSDLVRPGEPATCSRPSNDLVTVVQAHGSHSWSGPRVARVRSKKDVDLLKTGRLVLRKGWHSKNAIYPAGFKSQTRFIDVLDVFQTCMYVSQILECGPTSKPLFKVTHPTKQDVYVNESIDQCWHEIQNQVNEEIILRRSEDSSRQLPPLLPPPSGLEMFGLASASIVQAIEALDPQHRCLEYWSEKKNEGKQDQVDGLQDIEIGNMGMNRGCVEPSARVLQERGILAPERLSVNTLSRSPVNNHSKVATNQLAFKTGGTVQQPGNGTSDCSKVNQDLYPVLRGFFQKGSAEELKVLYRLFASEVQGAKLNTAFLAVTDELESRISVVRERTAER